MFESLASVLLLAFLLAVLLAYRAGGTHAVGAWLHAKFVGE